MLLLARRRRRRRNFQNAKRNEKTIEKKFVKRKRKRKRRLKNGIEENTQKLKMNSNPKTRITDEKLFTMKNTTENYKKGEEWTDK